jgi:nitroimidazol reductase NimA-like FMN-containing flavoprotein (pyridoxamine 5'-phosphate oxidase superfamily)
MLGILTKPQIDHVLRSQLIGRIGCSVEGKPYVVPVSYAYDGHHIYLHAQEGMKIKMMRKNPQVCFEVEALDNMVNWRSVILWGTYEELTSTSAQTKAMKILTDRLMPLRVSETIKPAHRSHAPEMVEKPRKAIVYRIRIKERTGRFEKTTS